MITHINELKLNLKYIDADDKILFDNILFSDCVYVDIVIDDHDLRDDPNFSDMLVVFSELLKSAEETGAFLIFTCACGIADDGGWGYVKVMHSKEHIKWDFTTDRSYGFIFNKALYVEQIKNIQYRLSSLKGERLIPKSIIYPE